jgi:saposin
MLMKSLVCLAIFAGQALANCRIGPSYWCASIPQAAQCTALPFCIKAVWTKEEVPKDTDEVCDICKNMVGQARDTLQSNETQEELREVFEGSCDLIPLKMIRKECKALADEFVPELVETLSSEMNPDTVCTVAGLCNSERIDTMLDKYYAETGYCKTCRTQMSSASAILSQADDSTIEGKLYELCAHMDSYSDACVYTVSTQLPVIRAMLETLISPESCTKSVCSDNDLMSLSAKYNEDVECEFCTKVVKHWIDVYASDSSLDEFKQILDGLCDKIDKSRADHCKHIVDAYYMPLFEYIKKVDPHMICSVVGICHNAGLDESSHAQPLSTFFPEQKSVMYTPLEPAQQTFGEGKSSCLLCEFAMQKLETFLEDKHNTDEIKDYLDGVCADVPGAYKDTCKTFVDAYAPIIVEMIASNIHPSQICKELKLCAAPPAPQPPKKSASCETCRIVTEEVFSVFSSKDDQDMVKNVLESMCYRFPEYIDEPCERFVNKYTTYFLDFIANNLTPEQFCDALDMCSAADDLAIDVYGMDKDAQSQDSACIICEYVVSYLDKALTNKTNEDEIKQGLEAVCDVLPSSVRDQCDSFVDAYTDMIIQLMTGEITPKEVCGYLGLCQNDMLAFQPAMPGTGPMMMPLADATNNGPYCTMCEYIITTVDKMLEDNQTEKEIEVSLDKVCYVLPSSIKKNCVELVRDYTDQIIHLLVNDYPPEQVCNKLALCKQN